MIVTARFKRVEAQVVQDELETTQGIFKKLEFLRAYFIVFTLAILLFQVPLFVDQYLSE